MAEFGMDELMALVASRRAELGIQEPSAETSVERELAKTANAVATSRLEARLQRTVSDKRTASSIRVPAGPDLRVVDLVHRGHDGYIPFSRKTKGGAWQELGCVPAHVLRGLFGADWLTSELEADGYFGLHGMFRTGFYRHRSTLTQLEPTLRKAQHVRWLTTAHVDLDLYNVGIDPEDGVATVLRASREGLIPPPSMFSLSRGCWAWWLLRDEQGNGPVRAWPDTIDRWADIQGQLHKRLASLGSDAAALHPATVTRIPGSYSRKTHRRVAWMACFDDDGQPFVYTLPDLADALGLKAAPATVIEHKPTPDPDRIKDPARIELGRRGHPARWDRFLSVLDQLRRMRGGWRVGTRTKAIHLVAHGCRARGWERPRCMEELRRHLDGMDQPNGDQLTDGDLRRVLKSTGRPRAGGVRWQTVADQLDISPEESAVLSTKTSRIPPARRHDQLPQLPAVPPEERQRRRREAIRAILERYMAAREGLLPYWQIPTTAVLRELLIELGHEGASDKTLLKDLDALGYPSPRRHKARQTAADRQLRLPAPE
jgi:hypothetical protein